MSKLEEYQIYKTVLSEAKKYHQDSIGLTNYLGLQGSDQTYLKILNFQTILLLELFQKTNTIEQKINLLEEKTLQLQDELAKKGIEIIPYRKPSYKSW